MAALAPAKKVAINAELQAALSVRAPLGSWLQLLPCHAHGARLPSCSAQLRPFCMQCTLTAAPVLPATTAADQRLADCLLCQLVSELVQLEQLRPV